MVLKRCKEGLNTGNTIRKYKKPSALKQYSRYGCLMLSDGRTWLPYKPPYCIISHGGKVRTMVPRSNYHRTVINEEVHMSKLEDLGIDEYLPRHCHIPELELSLNKKGRWNLADKLKKVVTERIGSNDLKVNMHLKGDAKQRTEFQSPAEIQQSQIGFHKRL